MCRNGHMRLTLLQNMLCGAFQKPLTKGHCQVIDSPHRLMHVEEEWYNCKEGNTVWNARRADKGAGR